MKSALSKFDARRKANELIQWYREGSDLDELQMHLLNDIADEHMRELEKICDMRWFRDLLARNIHALDNTP